MKSFNGNLRSGYNKFRKTINNSHFFRKASNTLEDINSFALPTLTIASAVQPELAPIFGGVGGLMVATQKMSKKLKNVKI